MIRRLLDWAGLRFRELDLPDPDDRQVTLVSGYQGMSLLANALREPRIMTREGPDSCPGPPPSRLRTGTTDPAHRSGGPPHQGDGPWLG